MEHHQNIRLRHEFDGFHLLASDSESQIEDLASKNIPAVMMMMMLMMLVMVALK